MVSAVIGSKYTATPYGILLITIGRSERKYNEGTVRSNQVTAECPWQTYERSKWRGYVVYPIQKGVSRMPLDEDMD